MSDVHPNPTGADATDTPTSNSHSTAATKPIATPVPATQLLPTGTPSTLPLASSTSSASLANFDYHCIVCKSDQIQKVSSIVKAGKWTGERNWSDSTQWSENSKTNGVSNLVGGAYNFGNDSFSIGGGQMRTRGNTNTSGSSGTSGQEASVGASG